MTVYFEFYHRTAGGTETLLGTSHDSDVLGTSETEFELHASITSDKIFVSGDRIVVKVYGRNTNAANKDITIHMEGDTVSRVEFPAFISPTFVPAHIHTHASTTGRTTDDHHAQVHTIVSHDTTATGAELDTLTDNSVADALHRHSELVASDGSPDPAVSVDAAGKVSISNDLRVDTDLLFVDIAPGRVGINTTPATDFHVVGESYFDGKVGIGTASPSNPLTLTGAGTTIPFFINTTGGSGTHAVIRITGGATNADWTFGTNRGDITANADDFFILKASGTSGAKLVIQDGGNVGIGTTTPATSAKLELSSTTGALLLTRMTTTQRNALTAVNGMVIYNSTTNAFNFYENGAWVSGSGLA